MPRDLFEGAMTAGEYQEKVLKSKVSPKALKGDDYPLPAPYNRRGELKEADVLKAVRDVLKSHMVWHRRLEGTGKVISTGAGEARMIPGEMAGMPDILACIAGRLVAIEVKTAGGRLSAKQLGTLRSIQEAGGVALIVCNAWNLATWLKTSYKGDAVECWFETIPIL